MAKAAIDSIFVNADTPNSSSSSSALPNTSFFVLQMRYKDQHAQNVALKYSKNNAVLWANCTKGAFSLSEHPLVSKESFADFIAGKSRLRVPVNFNKNGISYAVHSISLSEKPNPVIDLADTTPSPSQQVTGGKYYIVDATTTDNAPQPFIAAITASN